MAEAAERIIALLFKYDPNQPRDDQGRWGVGVREIGGKKWVEAEVIQ